MDIVYIALSTDSAFNSQVIALLNEINNKNVFEKMYLLLGDPNESIKRPQQLASNINFITFKKYPDYPLFSNLTVQSIKKSIKQSSINIEKTIFHTRSELAAYLLAKAFPNTSKILADIRGTVPEEVNLYYHNTNILLRKYKYYYLNKVRRNVCEQKSFSVVSDALKNYLVQKYSIKNKAKCYVNSCIADSNFKFNFDNRNEIRKELGLENNDVLFVFSTGGGAAWQSEDVVVKALSNKGYKILMLGKKQYNQTNIISKFVNYSEVPKYLNAADIAVIWRNNDIVNKVESPIKFSEYVACGLPVIANDSVELITDYIHQNNAGLIINNFAKLEIEDIVKLTKIDRTQIAQKAITIFGVEAITNRYLEIYKQLQ